MDKRRFTGRSSNDTDDIRDPSNIREFCITCNFGRIVGLVTSNVGYYVLVVD
jgi:hypothetical protein